MSTRTPPARARRTPARVTVPPAGGALRRRRPALLLALTVSGVVAAGIIVYAVYNSYESGLTWQQRADKISGIIDYHSGNPSIDTNPDMSVTGTVSYASTPPAYGEGNPDWQRCEGDVYAAQISDENAVHSMELGAVWITYDPAKLTAAQVSTLASTYVNGHDNTFMSPYPGQPTAVSVQTWGFQLRLSSPTDSRIARFISATRGRSSLDTTDTCTTGDYITATGTEPHDPAAAPSAAPSGAASAPAS